MNVILGTVIIYARDMHKTAAFYSQHFGLLTTGEVVEGLIELQAPDGGAGILIHQAAKSVKLGQVGVKLSFHVPDVPAFAQAAEKKGLKFGRVSGILCVRHTMSNRSMYAKQEDHEGGRGRGGTIAVHSQRTH